MAKFCAHIWTIEHFESKYTFLHAFFYTNFHKKLQFTTQFSQYTKLILKLFQKLLFFLSWPAGGIIENVECPFKGCVTLELYSIDLKAVFFSWITIMSHRICENMMWSAPDECLVASMPPSHHTKQICILCLIPRTTVTSLIASKNTRCKMHPLCVNVGVPFWTREKTHMLHARWQASSSGIRADVTVVLVVRQSIVSCVNPIIRWHDAFDGFH